MIQKIKSLALTFATLLVTAAPVLVAVPAHAADLSQTDINNQLCHGSNFTISATGAGTDCAQGGGVDSLNNLLAMAVNIFSAFVGVIAVIMIIVGGLRYITSGGDSSKVSGAKTTILYAIIGLVVVALAQLIVHFVINQANNIVAG